MEKKPKPTISNSGVAKAQRAQVAVELDFSRITETEETYNPESQVIRSEREKNEKSETQTNIAQGAPGTPTNVPDRAQASASNSPATIPQSTERLDHIKNYEIDKRTRRLESPHARVKRLSVGVIVHNLSDEEGEVGVSTGEPSGSDDSHRLTRSS